MAIRLRAEIPLVSDDRNLLQTQSSLIQQNADNILLRVAQSDFNGTNLVSLINLAPDTIKIQAKNIDISGLVEITNFTYANLGGTKPPVDADRTSTVINGGLVTTGTIQVGSGSTVRAGINGGGTLGTEVRFWAGQTFINRATAPFRVTQDGQLFATNANLTGTITASSGKIARFDISSNDLVYTSELFNKDYDRSDVNKLHRMLLGLDPTTPYDLWIYDVNSSGDLNITDLVIIDGHVNLGQALPTPRKRIRSVVTIGTNNGALINRAVAENGTLGPTTTIQGEKINTDLINARSISTRTFSTTSIVIGGSSFTLSRDANGFLRAT